MVNKGLAGGDQTDEEAVRWQDAVGGAGATDGKQVVGGANDGGSQCRRVSAARVAGTRPTAGTIGLGWDVEKGRLCGSMIEKGQLVLEVEESW